MANPRILFDKTEVVLIIIGKKKAQQMNLTYNNFISVSFEPCKEVKFIFPVKSQRIVLRTNKSGTPIIYTRGKEKAFFDSYLEGWRKFCKDNRITLYDRLSE